MVNSMKDNNKTKNIKYKDNIDKLKNNIVNEYGINLDIKSKQDVNYQKIYHFTNK